MHLLHYIQFRKVFFRELVYLSSHNNSIPDKVPCFEFGFIGSNIITLAFFWLIWEWYLVSYPFTFNLPFSLYLMWNSYRKYSWIFFIFLDKLFSKLVHLCHSNIEVIHIVGLVSAIFVTVFSMFHFTSLLTPTFSCLI